MATSLVRPCARCAKTMVGSATWTSAHSFSRASHTIRMRPFQAASIPAVGGKSARRLLREIASPQGRIELLDRVAQHHPRHRGRVLVEEGPKPGLIPLAGLPKHPADGLVDEVLVVIDEQLGDPVGVIEIA